MKKILTIFLLLLVSLFYSQVKSNFYIPDSLVLKNNKYTPIQITAGTCASPNGGMNSIGAPPASYAALQAGGYCNPAAYGKNGTVCWSFTPTQGSVNINSGFSTTGCAGVGFGPFTLYQCSPSCAVVGAGLNFTVTIGQCYTWCMTYSGIGGGCTFNDFCPYYQEFGVLPIDLSYFAGSNQGNLNVLQWKTETERNNDYFIIEQSSDAFNWNELNIIKGSGNSNHSLIYYYKDNSFKNIVNYYRLKQVDYDGSYKYHGIIVINNFITEKSKVLKIFNVFGQEVDETYKGIIILYYDNGFVEKKINQ